MNHRAEYVGASSGTAQFYDVPGTGRDFGYGYGHHGYRHGGHSDGYYNHDSHVDSYNNNGFDQGHRDGYYRGNERYY